MLVRPCSPLEVEPRREIQLSESVGDFQPMAGVSALQPPRRPAGAVWAQRGSADPHVPNLAMAPPQGHLLGKAARNPASWEQVTERECAWGSVRHATRALPVFGSVCQEDESQQCVCRPAALSCAKALPSGTCCSHSSSHGPNLPPPRPGPAPRIPALLATIQLQGHG